VVILALGLGWLLGFLGTIPAAGPLAVLVAAAAIEGRTRRLLALSAGGAAAEGLWAAAAASGLGWVIAAHPALERGMRVIGVALALILGVALLRLRLPPPSPEPPEERSASAALLGFLLVAGNPSFLASWLASCGALRAHPSVAAAATPAGAPWLGLGAALGVMGWFSTLGILARRQQALLVAWRARLFRGLGLGLLGLGLWGALRLVSGG
jgi:threonine/homoserine/homoserine lactone efflux protein